MLEWLLSLLIALAIIGFLLVGVCIVGFGLLVRYGSTRMKDLDDEDEID